MKLDRPPTERFTDRVDDYVRYRPTYPVAVLETLRADCGLTPRHTIADVGSGTGLLATLFLQNGNLVYGVEPNDAMRAAGETLLAGYDNFTSVAATAEATALASSSVDFITAGQAFHWFDPEAARREFRRILHPHGYVVLVWNSRARDASPFMAEFEQIMARNGTDYRAVRHTTAENTIAAFFTGRFEARQFPNEQTFDLDAFLGRALSSSYAPLPGDDRHPLLMQALRDLFARYQQQDQVRFLYRTELYFGHLT